MAKLSVPAPKPGISTLTHGAVERAILGTLIKARLDDYSKDIDVDQLGDLIGEEPRTIVSAINELRGAYLIEGSPHFSTDRPFRIGRISIELVPAGLLPDKNGQEKLPLDQIPAPQLTDEQKRDQERRGGVQVIDVEGIRYRAVVVTEKMNSSDGATYWSLNVTSEPVEGPGDRLPCIEDPQQFAVAPEAWAYFDEFLAGLAVGEPEPVLGIEEWVLALAPDPSIEGTNIILLDAPTFEAWVRSQYGADNDGSVEDLLNHGEGGYTDYMGADAVSYTIARTDGGNHWPGLDVPSLIPSVSDWVDQNPVTNESGIFLNVDEETFALLRGPNDEEDCEHLTWFWPGVGEGLIYLVPGSARWPGLDVATAKDSLVVEAEVLSIYDWAQTLAPSLVSGNRLMDPQSFEALVGFVYKDHLDDSDMVAQRGTDLKDGLIDVGGMYARDEHGPRWPGLPGVEIAEMTDEPDPERNIKDEDLHGSGHIQTEDGTHVDVKWEPKGRKRFEITLIGEVNQMALYTENVPWSKHKNDFEGWALRKAEELRAKLVKPA